MEKKLNIFLSPKKLRHYRKIAEKRQFQIADILGVDRTTYVGYEKQEALEVSLTAAKAVADFLNVQLSDLEKDRKVELVQLSDPTFKHLIFEGDYVGLHKKAWDEFQKTLEHNRKMITEITSTNSELGKGILEVIGHLTKATGDQKT